VITVEVPVGATGNVTVYVGGENHTGVIDPVTGKAVVTVDNVSDGDHTIAVEYTGDSNYSANYTVANMTVEKVKSDSEIIVVDHGNGTVVVVVGDNATGNVTIKVGDKEFNGTVVDGTAVITVEDITPGVHDVEVIYSGDDSHTNATVGANITAPKYDAGMNVTVGEAKEGEPIVITVEVPVGATGNVTVYVGGENHTGVIDPVTGKAVVTVDNVSAGDHTIAVEYTGDSNYSGNYTVANMTVEKSKIDSDLTVVDYGNGTVVVVVGDNATGNVTIKVGDKEYNATVIDGKAVVTLDNITPGIHDVEVIYSGDDSHTNATVGANITAPRYDAGMNVTVGEAKEGEPIVITVELPVGATGNVTVYVGGENHTGVIDPVTGKAVVTVDNVSAGVHTIAVEYTGDSNYSANYTVVNMTVEKVKSESDLTVVDYGNGTVVVVVGDNATGNVTIKVGDKEFNGTVVDGTAVITVEDITPGVHEVEVIYSGDDSHTNATVGANITAPRYDAGMNVTVGEAKEGEPIVITVELPGDATGNVTVYVGGKEFNATVENGKAVVTVDNVSAGVHTIAVEYTGDSNYSGNYTVANMTVEKAKSDLEIIVVDHGNGTVVVVVGDNATGNVTVKIGDKEFNTTVVDGVAVVNITDVVPGNHTVEVIYSGDDSHTNATVEANITAPKYDTGMNVTVGEAKEGEPIVITVELPVGATGNITVYVGGENHTGVIDPVTGKAVVTVDNVSAGDHTIAVEYTGDSNYSANYTVANMTVEKAKSDSEIIVVDYGNGTVVVVVGDNATGNVTIKVGDKEFNGTVVDGTAVITVEDITPGIHDVEVIYSGDDSHTNATVEANITAPKYDAGMNVTVGEAKEGEPIVITVELPGDATGNVTVYVGGKEFNATVEDGKAVVTVDNVSAGDHTIAVVYDGDSNYSGNYTVANMTVEKSKIDSDLTVVDYGNGTVVVVVGDNATGNVTIKVGDKEYNATVIDGKAVVTLDNVTPGIHDVEVIYSGDDAHTNATLNTTIDVSKGITPITVEVDSIHVGDNAIVKVTLAKDANGNVTIEIDGKTYTKEIVDGVAIFEIENLIAGEKSVFATYGGGDYYASAHASNQFNVSKVDSSLTVEVGDVKVGENVTVTVHVPKDATGQVLIDIDGVGYYVNVTDGVGTIQIPYLENGTYDMALTYVGDDKYLPSSNSDTFKVEKIASFVIPIANNIVVGENENIILTVPIDATGNVTVVIDNEEFNFNLNNGLLSAVYREGEKYSVAVSGGNGELVISGLPKGEYFVSVRYNGDYKYLPSENVTTFIVSKQNTPMNVIDQGNGTIEVILPSDAVGNVTVSDGLNNYTAEVINGTAVINLENTTPGKHEVVVKYDGNDEYSSNTTNIVVDIPKYDTPISVETANISVGETETVIVTLPEDATGTVTIEINGKEYTTTEIIAGKATFKVDGLAFGNKTVAVKYSGDNNYNDNYTTGQFVVSKVPSTIHAVGKDINVGTDEIITAFVPNDAHGRVLVNINDVGYYGDIINGKANIIIPELPSGIYTAEVIFEGDDKYLPSETQLRFTVSKVNTPISATGDEIPQGKDATVVVKVPSDATGTVTITIDNKQYTTEVKDGKAVFTVPGLVKGDYDVNASYSGDKKYDANDTITEVEVYFNETPAHPEDVNHHKMDNGRSSSLDSYATGNPIIALLLVLLAIGSTQIRRFKK